MARRLHRQFYPYARPAVSLLTAVVILAGALGIPVPRSVQKEVDQPFPCMHHSCGCMSAEACWQGCCCLTHEQKLAWAQKHGIEPPRGILTVATRPAGPGGSCCRSEECTADGDSDVQMDFVRIEDYRKCRGEASLWLVLSQALLVRPEMAAVDPKAVVGWLHPPLTVQISSPVFDPATPPPRAVL